MQKDTKIILWGIGIVVGIAVYYNAIPAFNAFVLKKKAIK